MAIELTPAEEALILEQRIKAARPQDIGVQNAQPQPAPSAIPSIEPPTPEKKSRTFTETVGTVWGGMVRGVKKIIKWTVIAVVATAAFVFLTGFLGGVAAASPTLAPWITPVLTHVMQPICNGIAGLGNIGSFFTGISSSVSTGANSLIAATGIGASAVAINKMVATHHASTHVVSQLPDVSFVSDPNHAMNAALAAKKTTIAQQTMDQGDMMNALPDSPNELVAATKTLTHASSAVHASHGAETAAHVAADKTHESMHRSRVNAAEQIRAARAAQSSWVERIGSPVETFASNERI
jgi:hypothetical protein